MKPRMSAESQARLEGALARMVQEVGAGAEPTPALAKVARDVGLPPGHVSLVATAFNVGRTETSRKQAADLTARIDPGGLADAAAALEMIYPDATATPHERAKAAAVSADYSAPPPAWVKASRDRYRTAPLEKRAAEACPEPKPAPYPVYRDKAPRRPYAREAQKRADLEAKAAAAQGSYERFRESAQAVARYFTRPQSPRPDEVRKYARHWLGERAVRLLDKALAAHPLAKRASHGPAPKAKDAEPYRLLAAALERAEEHAEAHAAYKEAQAAYAAARAETALPAPPAPLAPAATPLGVLAPPAAAAAKEASAFGVLSGAMGTTMARELAGRLPAAAPVSKLEDKAYRALTDPLQQAEIRNARLTASVSRMHAQHPVIKGYSLPEVSEAVNRLAQLSPRALESDALLESLVAKQLTQGGLDPYEADMLLRIEKGLKYRDTAADSMPQGGSGRDPDYV